MDKKQRIKWIDCIKAIAIFAVVVNHGFLVVYSNIEIAYMSFFSVSVFFMASGYTQHLSNKNKGVIELVKVTFKRIVGIFIPYTFVCLAYSTYYSVTLVKEINVAYIWNRFTGEILQFNLEGTFYFVSIYILMTLISPFLSKLIVLIESRGLKFKIGSMSFLTLSLLGIGLTILSITPEIYPDKYVLGATYLFVVFTGMLLSRTKVELIFNNKIVLLLSTALGIVFGIFVFDILGYFNGLGLPYGNVIAQINPPGLIIISYSLLVFVLLANIFNKMEQIKNRIAVMFVDLLASIGKATLYIYFYHYLVRRIILDFVWSPPMNIAIRILILLLMFFVPLLGKCAYDMIKRQFEKLIIKMSAKRLSR